MVLGAVAPIAYAPPVFREVFFGPLVRATYPLGAGLEMSADLLLAGWLGASLLSMAAAAGLAAAKLVADKPQGASSRRSAVAGLLVVGLIALVTAAVYASFLVGSFGSAAGAMWVLMTGAVGAYGARMAARKENWHASVGGAVALFAGGRFVLAAIALSMLVASDKHFPGQTVALYPWRRSQVALEPLVPAPAMETAPDAGVHPAASRGALPSVPFLTGLAIVIGAALPIAYSPWWRREFFEPLVLALWPLTVFVPVTADFLWTSLVGLFWVGGTTVGAVYCARFAFGRSRRGGALAGGMLLILGGRPLLGLAVIAMVLAAWGQYGRSPAGHEVTAEKPAEAAAH
jgi:hypothetical protein